LFCDKSKNRCGCPAGKFKDTIKEICEQCPLGRFNNVPMVRGECAACVEGQYADTNGAQNCLNCDSGKYTSTEGSSSCATCPVGRRYIDTQTDCSVCLGGEYQPSDTTSHANCTKCPIGYFNSDTGVNRVDIKHEKCTACNISEGFISNVYGGLVSKLLFIIIIYY